eukprot:COSAG02_NODE_31166_length_538_cov_0.993166_1_plen_135_part_10
MVPSKATCSGETPLGCPSGSMARVELSTSPETSFLWTSTRTPQPSSSSSALGEETVALLNRQTRPAQLTTTPCVIVSCRPVVADNNILIGSGSGSSPGVGAQDHSGANLGHNLVAKFNGAAVSLGGLTGRQNSPM